MNCPKCFKMFLNPNTKLCSYCDYKPNPIFSSYLKESDSISRIIVPQQDSRVERKQIVVPKDKIQYKQQQNGYKICPNCNKDYYSLALGKCLNCKYSEDEEEPNERKYQGISKESDKSNIEYKHMKSNAKPP